MPTPRSTVTADLGAGPEALDAPSWSIKRDLSGGSLPAQVRGGSGFALATGSVDVTLPDGRTPWTTEKIRPGGEVSITAAVSATDTDQTVGDLKIRSVGASSALSRSRRLAVEDILPKARLELPQLLASMVDPAQIGLAPFDAVWVIDQAARACGFHATPEPVPSALLCVHACGSPLPEVGTYAGAGLGERVYTWPLDHLGRVSMRFELPVGGARPVYTLAGPIPVGATAYLTLNKVRMPGASSTLTFWDRTGESITFTFGHSPTEVYPTFRHGHTSPGGSVDLPAVVARSDWRVQVQIERTSATETRARVRSAGGWSSWATSTGVAVGELTTMDQSTSLSGLQVHLADADAALTSPTAWLASADSPLSALVGIGDQDAWTVAQQVASCTLGALWLAEDGVLRYRNRSQMRGGEGTGGAARIVAATTVEDLPWSVSEDDVADRVEVTYQPADVQTVTDYSLTVWESPDVLAIKAGKTSTLVVDLEAPVDQLAPWLSVTSTAEFPIGQRSRWAASTTRDGSVVASATALQVSAVLVNPSRARISIKNTTGSTLYTGGATSSTALILRANVVARSGEAVTIDTGKAAADALSPLQVSLAPWVQDEDTAESVLAWLADQTSKPLPVLEDVNVVPDLTVRLGDVRVLEDPDFTELTSKVLIVGNTLSGDPSGLKQQLRLVVLSTLVRDVDEYYESGGTVQTLDDDVVAALTAGATVDAADGWLERRYLS
ncbi:hypothetical protein [Cellulomonas uda]|uniref:Uncharacterized protein n=1 Tax=Cellulomonas uda TaxID=1714 RepID=A0A4Y3KAR8_CELUD|nr:hypothetical protein [Cellulomonas uda]NII67823.1 hypothetical protein [Cellulomonas uda]GEA79930.1 hypothetical protein CUD01_03740 [Cellulomonas uda]